MLADIRKASSRCAKAEFVVLMVEDVCLPSMAADYDETSIKSVDLWVGGKFSTIRPENKYEIARDHEGRFVVVEMREGAMKFIGRVEVSRRTTMNCSW